MQIFGLGLDSTRDADRNFDFLLTLDVVSDEVSALLALKALNSNFLAAGTVTNWL